MNRLMLVRLGDVDLVPRGSVRLFIARQPVRNMDKYGLHHVPTLAPSADLLWAYKDGKITWKDYVERYRVEMTSMRQMLDKIYRQLEETPVALVCYCATAQCHRFLLGHFFEEIGVQVDSLKKDDEQ